MALPSVPELIPVLQIAIGPVILISGVGLLLLSMTNRLGRAIDRSRVLCHELQTETPTDQVNTRAQLQILRGRARLLRRAITLASVSILLAAGASRSEFHFVTDQSCLAMFSIELGSI